MSNQCKKKISLDFTDPTRILFRTVAILKKQKCIFGACPCNQGLLPHFSIHTQNTTQIRKRALEKNFCFCVVFLLLPFRTNYKRKKKSCKPRNYIREDGYPSPEKGVFFYFTGFKFTNLTDTTVKVLDWGSMDGPRAQLLKCVARKKKQLSK